VKYRIVVKRRAEKELGSLPQKDIKRIVTAIDSLAENPLPLNTKKLSGQKDRWRIRVGHYRILYTIDESERLITIFRIGHRKDIYRFWN